MTIAAMPTRRNTSPQELFFPGCSSGEGGVISFISLMLIRLRLTYYAGAAES